MIKIDPLKIGPTQTRFGHGKKKKKNRTWVSVFEPSKIPGLC